MLHRFRKAMVRRDRERLHAQVEVDETYLAITDREAPIAPAKRKRNSSKVLVAVAVKMLQPKGLGRIRLQRIDNDSDACVVPFVQASIVSGAQVRTDGSAAYRSLSSLGHEHERIVMLGSEVVAHVSMPVGASSGIAGQALDPRDTPRIGAARAPRRLSRRIRFPPQPPHFGLARNAVLPAAAASRNDRSDDLQRRGRSATQAGKERIG
jgi:hypothetical protein